jgi:hypothetical protein
MATSGERSEHVTQPVDYTVKSPYYTQRCGFPVLFSLIGTLKTTLVLDAQGAVIREMDTQPGTTQTFRAPESGKSFSFPFANILTTDYPEGAAVGRPAIAVGRGLAGKVPGIPADAGTVTFGQGTVVVMTPSGVPIVDLGPVTDATGHANDPNAIDDAICAALA